MLATLSCLFYLYAVSSWSVNGVFTISEQHEARLFDRIMTLEKWCIILAVVLTLYQTKGPLASPNEKRRLISRGLGTAYILLYLGFPFLPFKFTLVRGLSVLLYGLFLCLAVDRVKNKTVLVGVFLLLPVIEQVLKETNFRWICAITHTVMWAIVMIAPLLEAKKEEKPLNQRPGQA